MRKTIAIVAASVFISSGLAFSDASFSGFAPTRYAGTSQFNLKARPLSAPFQEVCGGAFVLQESFMACFSPYKFYYADVSPL